MPYILFYLGIKQESILPYFFWLGTTKMLVKANLRIAHFFPVHINEYNGGKKQVKDRFSILKEIIMLSLSRKCITLFALILDAYKSILKTLFICILSAYEIYASPLHFILLHFFTSRDSATKV